MKLCDRQAASEIATIVRSLPTKRQRVYFVLAVLAGGVAYFVEIVTAWLVSRTTDKPETWRGAREVVDLKQRYSELGRQISGAVQGAVVAVAERSEQGPVN